MKSPSIKANFTLLSILPKILNHKLFPVLLYFLFSNPGMGKLFKKFRVKRADERNKAKEKPKTKKIQEIHTHKKEHDDVEKIFYCLCIGNRRKTAYRKIIDLDEGELEKNIFLISEKLLEVTVNFDPIDKLFFPSLKKILSLRNSAAIHGLLVEYFLASILCGAQYESFGLFLVRNIPAVFLQNRDRFLSNLPHGELQRRIHGLKIKTPHKSAKFQQKILVLREQILIDAESSLSTTQARLEPI